MSITDIIYTDAEVYYFLDVNAVVLKTSLNLYLKKSVTEISLQILVLKKFFEQKSF